MTTEIGTRVRHKTLHHYGVGTVVEIIRPLLGSQAPSMAWVQYPGTKARCWIADLVPETAAVPLPARPAVVPMQPGAA